MAALLERARAVLSVLRPLWPLRPTRLMVMGRFAFEVLKLRLGLVAMVDPAVPVLLQLLKMIADAQAAAGLVRRTVITARGVRINYLEKVPPSGTPPTQVLLLLHGGTQDTRAFHLSFAQLGVSPGCRVLIPDGIGHGERIEAAISSGAYEYSVDERADDLHDFLEAVLPSSSSSSSSGSSSSGSSGDGSSSSRTTRAAANSNSLLAKCDVLGYSLGGSTALAYVHRHGCGRIHRICLVAPAVCTTDLLEKETQRGYFRYAYANAEDTCAFLEVAGLKASVVPSLAPALLLARQLQAVPADYWVRMWTGVRFRSNVVETADRVCSYSVDAVAGAEALAKAGVPMLVVQGSLDLVVHERGPIMLRERFARAGRSALITVKMLAGYGHTFDTNADELKLIFDVAFREALQFFSPPAQMPRSPGGRRARSPA